MKFVKRKIKDSYSVEDNTEDVVTEIDCPHCSMIYKCANNDNKIMDGMQQVHWISKHPEFYEEAERVADNVFRCASCLRCFILDIMTGRTRPLKRPEMKKFDPRGRIRHKQMKFTQLEAAYIGLQRFSNIVLTGFDTELGILYFKDNYGHDCQIELAPTILKAFIVDNSSDMKVKNSIINALRISKDSHKNFHYCDENEHKIWHNEMEENQMENDD